MAKNVSIEITRLDSESGKQGNDDQYSYVGISVAFKIKRKQITNELLNKNLTITELQTLLKSRI